jgi:hypothetical protein
VGLLHHRGATAQALLTEMVSQSNGNNGFGQSTSGHSVYRVRVEPDGGIPFESQLSLRGYMGLSGHRLLGRWVQVCYDAKAPAKCEIDQNWVKALPRGVLMPMNLREDQQWTQEHSAGRTTTLNVADLFKASDRPAQPQEGSHQVAASLVQLAELHAQGALTDAEFAVAKADLLS